MAVSLYAYATSQLMIGPAGLDWLYVFVGEPLAYLHLAVFLVAARATLARAPLADSASDRPSAASPDLLAVIWLALFVTIVFGAATVTAFSFALWLWTVVPLGRVMNRPPSSILPAVPAIGATDRAGGGVLAAVQCLLYAVQ